MNYKKPVTILALFAGLVVFSSSSMATWGGGYRHCGGSSNNTPSYPSECDSPLGDNTYNLIHDGVTSGTDSSVNNAVNVSGVDVVVSSWSDTESSSSQYNTDDIVVSADQYEIFDGNNQSYGYGILNEDGEKTWHNPDHAIDNNYYENGNSQFKKEYYADFDFVLFSFSEAVTLTGANFGWAQTKSNSQVSVAALSDISLLSSGSGTWASIAGGALAKNSFDIEECETGYISPFDFTQSAKYWLVGAYNVAFGDITGGQTFNDAFKLAAVGFNKGSPNTPSQVSAPGTIGLFLLSGLAIGMRRVRRT
ncbi:exosortase-dependent surface protein XDP1 [Alteromonas halophila]|uniref:PEP-CTERM sorting domain-containing protein n=1 Tax=Alteromonas halophila TaxID=516698 RepID=A0A918MYD8_9ALTE|nr:exosortase-dependent surface protein XDP1 [Alteromonas halophila]GGW85631.1 hypothetical protein GCM10007391_19020 [Alteromonas halophila]